MKKRATFTIDEGVLLGLKYLPRAFSVSQYVNYMLKALLKEMRPVETPEEMLEQEVEMQEEPMSIEEGIREGWGFEESVVPVQTEAIKEDKTKGRKKKR